MEAHMKLKILSIVILSLTLATFGLVAVSGAQSFRTGDTSTISSSEVIDGSAYIAGSIVDVAGTIDGDLYCAGENVTISGTVKGDIICAAQTLNFTGTTTGDIRLGGQTVTVGGAVDGSATIAGQTITLESKGSIGRDATFAGQNTIIRGEVSRDINVGSETLLLDSTVGRNVTADVNYLKLEAATDVGGVFNYTSPQTFTKADGANIVGAVNYTERSEEATSAANFDPTGVVIAILMLLVSSVMFALVFPQVLHNVTRKSVSSPSQALLSVLVGFVAGIVMPVVIGLIMVTILGIPFGIVVLIAWCLIVASSGVFAAYSIGRFMWPSQRNIILATLIGALIISVLLFIPLVNIFVVIVSVSYGSGVVLRYLQKYFKAPNYSLTTTPTKK